MQPPPGPGSAQASQHWQLSTARRGQSYLGSGQDDGPCADQGHQVTLGFIHSSSTRKEVTYRGHAHPQGTAVLGNASNPSMSTRNTGTNSSWHTAGPLNTPCTHGITGGQGGTAPYPATLPAALALQQQSINMEVMGPGLLILLLWPQLSAPHPHAAHGTGRESHRKMGFQKLYAPPLCNPMAMAARARSDGGCQGPAVPGCSSLQARVWHGPCHGHEGLLRVKRADDSAKEHHPPHLFWGHRV